MYLVIFDIINNAIVNFLPVFLKYKLVFNIATVKRERSYEKNSFFF